MPSSSSTHFPLRWESTGDQWWFASPIDWAAANGHYDLVRELLRLDGNHLIKLTSLRRIRRLETVWDDEAQFDHVAMCRSQVARKLLAECENQKGKDSLIGGGCGGWLLYTAASAGDLSFVQELLQRDPLLVFGEGEYGATDILYAAARSKNSDVFKLVFNYALSPRFSSGRDLEGHVTGDIPLAYKWEMMNRAVHAAARGGILEVLKEILAGSSDPVSAYRDKQGATILHAAAARGQVQVVKYLITSYYDMISSTDNQGNTALHIAAARGQLAVVEALTVASPPLISSKNEAGETFLHVAVTGFQTPCFRRLDRQIELMKNLVSGKVFNVEEIVNTRNNEGRTALQLAIISNIHSELVELLMSVGSTDVNARDKDGMTALDILRQRPRSESSERITRKLMSAGGMFSSCHDGSEAARRVIASHLRMQSMVGGSPGTSFRIPDPEILTIAGGSEKGLDTFSSSTTTATTTTTRKITTRDSVVSEGKLLGAARNAVNKTGTAKHASAATQRLKRLFSQWPKIKKRDTRSKLGVNKNSRGGGCHQRSSCEAGTTTPIPLRQRFSKRTLCVGSNNHPLSSTTPWQRSTPSLTSFSISSSSLGCSNKQQGGAAVGPTSGCRSTNDEFDEKKGGGGGGPHHGFVVNNNNHHNHKRSSSSSSVINQYFCFGSVPGGPQARMGAPPLHPPLAGLNPPFELYGRSVLSTA
ncbi:unnamed protein product [Cuscuta campestris]|uniref:Uncharacterized protein n=1 Tax=Cuscuta campestris TaxID=132261 RepID=A0A484MQ31_9ASTE|nr:unnamed protein product [Cuscuta campestris]